MNKALEDIQKKLENELDKYKQVQKEHHKTITLRQQIDAQLSENEIVKKELDFVKEENKVYKLIGPVLVKVGIEDAKENVGKRMEYITKEIKRLEENLVSMEKKQDVHRENLQKLQHQYQQAQVKAAMQA